METLRGIRIFGYGTLIPLDVIPQKQPHSLREDTSHTLYGSYTNTQGVITPINYKDTLDEVEEELPSYTKNNDMNNSQRSLKQNSFGIESPTRISSTDQLNSLDKYTTRSNNPNTFNDDLFNSNGMFNGTLFDKIVEKAEFGRVVMGVQDI